MTGNQLLEAYLADVRGQLGGLAVHDRDAVLAEMRSHLEEDIRRRRERDPGLSVDEATLRATHAFGDPREIGVSFGPQGGTVRNQAGDVLLTLAHTAKAGLAATGRGLRATGRGLGRTLKWTAIVVVGLLVVGLVSAVTVVFLFQDDIRGAIPWRLFEKSQGFDNRTGFANDSLVVGSHLREVRLELSAHATGSGCVAISVRSPSGLTTFESGDVCDYFHQLLILTETGTWTLQYRFNDFDGRIHVDADGYVRP